MQVVSILASARTDYVTLIRHRKKWINKNAKSHCTSANCNTETFWITTGMFPQEFILVFANLIKISSMKIHCYNVRSLGIERSIAGEPVDFEPMTNTELEHSEEQLQVEEFTQDGTRATHLRLVIKSGFDHCLYTRLQWKVQRKMPESTLHTVINKTLYGTLMLRKFT
ncbi:intraflagellar transport protein 25 homolog [Chiloscyllium punctatum]|uniref:intraflagellar transport protein 25 homolog n=1 Tax=Chiloscyllium punctatum TaxID=137246 RepID=UPI003B6321E4